MISVVTVICKNNLVEKADELGDKYFVVIAGEKTKKRFTPTLTSTNKRKSGSRDPLWFPRPTGLAQRPPFP